MRILGIDPGSTATGFGIIDRNEGRAIHVAHGTLRPPRGADLAPRLAFLLDGIRDVVEGYAPEVAAVEQVFVARNPHSAVVLGQARGVALAAIGSAGILVREYSAREVKQSTVGTGSATKEQVQSMVKRLLELSRAPQSDAADALALALCHATAGPLAELGVRRGGRKPRTLRSVARGLR